MKLIEIWKRLWKQPLVITQHTEAVVFVNGEKYVISNILYDSGKFIGFETEPKNKKSVIKMREATKEEQESVQRYIDSISKPTGINFFDLINDERSSCNTFHNNLKTGCDFGGEYKYYDIIDYDKCCTCVHFSDNEYEERFECLNMNRKDDKCYEEKEYD